jgi:hypothetical protein
MLPTLEQAAALDATLRTCTAAASWLSAAMHAGRVHRKHDVQKRFYIELKVNVLGAAAAEEAAAQGGAVRRRYQPSDL